MDAKKQVEHLFWADMMYWSEIEAIWDTIAVPKSKFVIPSTPIGKSFWKELLDKSSPNLDSRKGKMSHAYGQVCFGDGTVMHYEYDSTSDYAISPLYLTPQEVGENWRSNKRSRCTCGNDEPVGIAADYGRGFYWNGRACRHCMAITAGFSPYDHTEWGRVTIERGLPEWWKVNDSPTCVR